MGEVFTVSMPLSFGDDPLRGAVLEQRAGDRSLGQLPIAPEMVAVGLDVVVDEADIEKLLVRATRRHGNGQRIFVDQLVEQVHRRDGRIGERSV